MRDHGSWSVSLGRWSGVQVRLHLFFLLFAAFSLYLSWLYARPVNDPWLTGIAVLSLGVLLLSVLAHEWGHYQAARRLGGGADCLVLWPAGGLVPVKVPRQPRSELIVHLAGPAVNLGICLACLPLLLWQSDVHLWGLLHPLRPANVADGGGLWIVASRLTLWINWLLVVVNLLPAFPFDGGRVLRAALLLGWPQLGRQQAATLVARVAKLSAVGLLVLAWLMRGDQIGTLLPTWFPLVLLAIFFFFSARQEEERQEEPDEPEGGLFGYDFSQGYTSLEASNAAAAPPAGPLARWLEQRRAARHQRQQQREAEEERRVDEILGRLHQQGPGSLSAEDRALLQRVSARYRDRIDNRAGR